MRTLALGLALWASPAFGQAIGGPPLDDAPTRADALGWREGTPRAFVAGAFDLGYLYVRPRLQAGYGKPHHLWVGLEVNPIVWFNALGGYSGVRLHHPNADLRVGGRVTRPSRRSYLPPRASYERADLNRDLDDEGATYGSLEAQLTLSLPAGRGSFFSETTVTYITLVPEDRWIYEDYLKVIVAPPWVWRQRVGYELRVGRDEALRLGFAAELVGIPGREMTALRAGILLRFRVNARLEVRGAWIPAIILRDELGVRGGDFGLLGMRYRWATGGVRGAAEASDD